MKAITYIEIDVPDFADSSPEIVTTYRFASDCGYLPTDIEAIPSLMGVTYSPATISLGKDLGQRASLTVTFKDHRHVFASESFDSGTFWGKWRARYGQRLRGRSLRWINGLLGQSLAEMETRHFIIESTEGPTPQGGYSIVAKDVLKAADGDRSQAPRPSNGFITGTLTVGGTSATLSPSGVGAEYTDAGYVNIGGEEICAFTRSGDTLTLTRAQLDTVAVEHDAGARVQLCLRYVGEDPADIIADLFENYADIDPDYIPLENWLIETGTYLQQNYSATIAEPTSVNMLVSELIEQAALAIWWDPLSQLIRLQVLRAIPSGAETFSQDNTLEGSLMIREQPATRLSQVMTYFGQRNPLAKLDDPASFRSVAVTIDAEAEVAYGTPAIKKIYSRWIPFGARSVALRLNDLQLGRFADPPRNFKFAQFRYGEITPQLGGGYQITAWPLQDMTGAAVSAPLQVTRINPLSDRYEVEAEEMLVGQVDPGDLVNRTIIIDADINSVNLRELHDSIYPDPDPSASPAESLTVIVAPNVIVGSNSTTVPAVTVGDWPVGYPITLQLYGRIQGRGGDGGNGGEAVAGDGTDAGGDGGTALYTRYGITVDVLAGGEIWGGGGGGAAVRGYDEETGEQETGYGGGGGAGQPGGAGGASFSEDVEAQDGTNEDGGAGADAGLFKEGGDGGDPGEDGTSPFGIGNEGEAGAAIDGVSYLVFNDSSPTSVRGATVN